MIDRDALMRLIAKHPIEAPPPDLGREKRAHYWKAHLEELRRQGFTPKVTRGKYKEN